MSQTAEEFSNPSASAVTPAPLRFITAASLFDGHDAAINLMRRLIQAEGCEVVHLGHNRSVADIVRAAICEDADGIAVSSYQGGHNEFFKYMVDMLAEQGAGHIQVFGGGGGTITPEEIAALEAHGVNRIYHPQDGMKMGLTEMIADLVSRTQQARRSEPQLEAVDRSRPDTLAAVLSAIENGRLSAAELALKRREWAGSGVGVPVLGLTGTGGAGKSSVTDELISRFLQYFPDMSIAVLAVDPTRRRTGGALLGDRIRMNTLRSERVFMRSMATRRAHMATSEVVRDCVSLLRASDFDLVILETAGIGQSDSEVVDLVDFPIYVMTSEYGAASQLEKIDMLDFAELVILNKFDRQGSQDALRDVRKQWRRNRMAFQLADDDTPVYPTIASQFNDPGVTWMFSNLCRLLMAKDETSFGTDRCNYQPKVELDDRSPKPSVLIPAKRVRYLAEIAEQGRGINRTVADWADDARRAQHYYEVIKALDSTTLPAPLEVISAADDRS
ncbi:MAG: cobalamin-dependent protein, partial [Pseudomonadota bacterium]